MGGGLHYALIWVGFVYVIFVIDVFARRTVGWSATCTAHASLVHHSNRGMQYCVDQIHEALGRSQRCRAVRSNQRRIATLAQPLAASMQRRVKVCALPSTKASTASVVLSVLGRPRLPFWKCTRRGSFAESALSCDLTAAGSEGVPVVRTGLSWWSLRRLQGSTRVTNSRNFCSAKPRRATRHRQREREAGGRRHDPHIRVPPTNFRYVEIAVCKLPGTAASAVDSDLFDRRLTWNSCSARPLRRSASNASEVRNHLPAVGVNLSPVLNNSKSKED